MAFAADVHRIPEFREAQQSIDDAKTQKRAKNFPKALGFYEDAVTRLRSVLVMGSGLPLTQKDHLRMVIAECNGEIENCKAEMRRGAGAAAPRTIPNTYMQSAHDLARKPSLGAAAGAASALADSYAAAGAASSPGAHYAHGSASAAAHAQPTYGAGYGAGNNGGSSSSSSNSLGGNNGGSAAGSRGYAPAGPTPSYGASGAGPAGALRTPPGAMPTYGGGGGGGGGGGPAGGFGHHASGGSHGHGGGSHGHGGGSHGGGHGGGGGGRSPRGGLMTALPREALASGTTVYFYEKHAPFYEFTNFFIRTLLIDNQPWMTSEHYFQAGKFTDPALQEQARLQRSARDVFDFARRNDRNKRADWETFKLGRMRMALWAKFHDHDDLRNLLLSTGGARLVEASPVDGYWGYGKDRQGKNMLGIMLEEVRQLLVDKGYRFDPNGPGAAGASGASNAGASAAPGAGFGRSANVAPPLPNRPSAGAFGGSFGGGSAPPPTSSAAYGSFARSYGGAGFR